MGGVDKKRPRRWIGDEVIGVSAAENLPADTEGLFYTGQTHIVSLLSFALLKHGPPLNDVVPVNH